MPAEEKKNQQARLVYLQITLPTSLCSPHKGPVHNTLKEFENEGFNVKTHQRFFVHTTPEEFENTTITGHFGCV